VKLPKNAINVIKSSVERNIQLRTTPNSFWIETRIRNVCFVESGIDDNRFNRGSLEIYALTFSLNKMGHLLWNWSFLSVV